MVSVDTIKGQKSAIATLGKFLPELSSYTRDWGHFSVEKVASGREVSATSLS